MCVQHRVGTRGVCTEQGGGMGCVYRTGWGHLMSVQHRVAAWGVYTEQGGGMGCVLKNRVRAWAEEGGARVGWGGKWGDNGAGARGEKKAS